MVRRFYVARVSTIENGEQIARNSIRFMVGSRKL